MAEQETTETIEVAETLEEPGAGHSGNKFLGEPVPDLEPVVEEPENTVSPEAAAAEARERSLWIKAGKDPARFDELQPESRQVELELAMVERRTEPTPANESESETSPANITDSDVPPIPQLLAFDKDALLDKFKTSYESEDNDGQVSVLAKIFDLIENRDAFINARDKVYLAAMEKQDQGIGALSRPALLRAALPKVSFATEDDIAQADALMANGQAKTAQDALILAAGARYNRDGMPVQGPTGETPAEKLKRAKKGINASGLNTGSVNTPASRPIGRTGGNFASQAGRDLIADLDAER